MFSVGAAMYLQIPGESTQRILHPGKVIEADEQTFVVELPESLAPAVGSTVIAYSEFKGKFRQQAAGVVALRPTAVNCVVALRRIGDASIAESRASYRVGVAMAGLRVDIGEQRQCLLADISPEGFAAITPSPLRRGDMVEVALQYERELLRGQVRVQVVKPLPNGQFRCGLLVTGRSTPVRRALEKITVAMQRAQLRRLSRAG